MKYAGLILLLLPLLAASQPDWPRSITSSNGDVIKIYHPQPDSFAGNILLFKAAFSRTRKGETEPQYGSFQAINTIETDRNQRTLDITTSTLLRLNTSIPLPPDTMEMLKETIECGLPGIGNAISLDLLIALTDTLPASGPPAPLNNDPPQIFIAEQPAILVLIDGIPRFKRNKQWGVRVVINSPYAIAESTDGWYYLYGGRHWYLSPSPNGPFRHSGYFPQDLVWMQTDINFYNRDNEEHIDTLREGNAGIRDIIVGNHPAELLQTRGAPSLRPIPGTSLQYVANTDNDIFWDTLSRKYFILLSGRWFTGAHLRGKWTYIRSDSLPAGFANIPEGSPMDRVLPCVAGTAPAQASLLDAIIPQTASVSRAARATIRFDGPPRFQPILNTRLSYALNSSAPVFFSVHQYYALDRGVWFTAKAPEGPWTISEQRPEDMEAIPPDCPVYYCKFAHIYGMTSDYIITGYTPGFLGVYRQGSTLVYGTGYYYPSWTQNISYPRPWTWGFNMWTHPWLGWAFGYEYPPDWLNTGPAWDLGYWNGGWWGPEAYRPPYIWHHFSGHGLFQQDSRHSASASYNNNIYLTRPDTYTRPEPDLVFTDRKGNIYRKENGTWSLRTGSSWTAIDSSDLPHWQTAARFEACHRRAELRTFNKSRL